MADLGPIELPVRPGQSYYLILMGAGPGRAGGTASMMAAKGAVYPTWSLMEDAGVEFDPSSYLSAVTGYYSSNDGKMLSMPFNSSTPVLYYNKDAFAKIGAEPPKTSGEERCRLTGISSPVTCRSPMPQQT